MLKKTWMILLAAVLVFGLVGCMDVKDEVPAVWKTVFDMATNEDIQAIDLGAITLAPDGQPSPLAPLMNAGGATHVSFEAVAGPSTQAVSLQFTQAADWGPGIDLPYRSFAFNEGDKIKIVGSIVTLASGKLQLNSRVGAERAIGGVKDEAGAFTIEHTLTADDVGFIKGGNPAGLRLEARAASSAGMVVKIDNITIEGFRKVQQLKAPSINLTGDIVSWAEIDGAAGYEIYANDVLVATTTNLQFDLSTLIGDELESLGTYTIYVIALGIEGASTDSKKSNTRTYNAPEVLDIYDVPVGGEDFFFVNLNRYKTPMSAANGPVPVGELEEDSLTLSFTENGQAVTFDFSPEQVALLKTGGSADVVIIATANPDSQFRYCIGAAAAGGSWNGTDLPSGALSGILNRTLTFGGANHFYNPADGHDRATSFILQLREAVPTEVVIESIKITVKPATVTVDVDGADQTVDIGVFNGIIQKTDDGYTFTKTQGYNWAYAYFGLDLGSDTLGDYEGIELDWTGISGDIGWKNLFVLVSDTPFDGELDRAETNIINEKWWNSYNGSLGLGPQVNGTTTINIRNGDPGEPSPNTTDGDMALMIDTSKTTLAAFTGTVYFCIYIDAAATGDGEPTKFNIENIKFVK